MKRSSLDGKPYGMGTFSKLESSPVRGKGVRKTKNNILLVIVYLCACGSG